MRLTYNLIQSLRLDGWDNLLPVYTPEEMRTIESELSKFQEIANDVVGGEARFHPEVVGPITRMQTAQALEDLAGRDWKFTDKSELPEDWKARVSTYLKAWASNLNPSALREMADMLVKAGYKTEAKQALEVILLFPTYADVYFSGADGSAELTNRIVKDAKDSLNDL